MRSRSLAARRGRSGSRVAAADEKGLGRSRSGQDEAPARCIYPIPVLGREKLDGRWIQRFRVPSGSRPFLHFPEDACPLLVAQRFGHTVDHEVPDLGHGQRTRGIEVHVRLQDRTVSFHQEDELARRLGILRDFRFVKGDDNALERKGGELDGLCGDPGCRRRKFRRVPAIERCARHGDHHDRVARGCTTSLTDPRSGSYPPGSTG
jgi:hypothetical protein